MFHGKIHYKWWFSIVMLNYQRVLPFGGHSLLGWPQNVFGRYGGLLGTQETCRIRFRPRVEPLCVSNSFHCLVVSKVYWTTINNWLILTFNPSFHWLVVYSGFFLTTLGMIGWDDGDVFLRLTPPTTSCFPQCLTEKLTNCRAMDTKVPYCERLDAFVWIKMTSSTKYIMSTLD